MVRTVGKRTLFVIRVEVRFRVSISGRLGGVEEEEVVLAGEQILDRTFAHNANNPPSPSLTFERSKDFVVRSNSLIKDGSTVDLSFFLRFGKTIVVFRVSFSLLFVC